MSDPRVVAAVMVIGVAFAFVVAGIIIKALTGVQLDLNTCLIASAFYWSVLGTLERR